ncbi:hypothetical protein [Massilia sp. Root335]|uniref:hypothetical protein n=1 Tax=Massilia sp. Root335 TaxID=1736517 RepID=UPI0012F664FD|nr:hypothetical protein [Massilia sp. Root335]
MKRFIEGEGRRQRTLLPEFLDDYVAEDNPVRAVDVFVEELNLGWRSAAAESRLERIAPAGPKSCLVFFAYAGPRLLTSHFCLDSAYAAPAISAAIA